MRRAENQKSSACHHKVICKRSSACQKILFDKRGRERNSPATATPTQFPLKSCGFPGVETARKIFLLWEMGFPDAKISRAHRTCRWARLKSRGLRALSNSPGGFFDSLSSACHHKVICKRSFLRSYILRVLMHLRICMNIIMAIGIIHGHKQSHDAGFQQDGLIPLMPNAHEFCQFRLSLSRSSQPRRWKRTCIWLPVSESRRTPARDG